MAYHISNVSSLFEVLYIRRIYSRVTFESEYETRTTEAALGGEQTRNSLRQQCGEGGGGAEGDPQVMHST